MLSQEAIEAFKNEWYSFEEIQQIEQWLRDIEEWNVYTQEEVDAYIENEIFGKYKIHA